MRLSEQDREALADWWEIGGDFVGDWNVSTLLPAVEAIVERHVTAALNEAADALRRVDATAFGADAETFYQALDTAARIVRTAANANAP